MKKVIAKIEDMHCEHCKHVVEKAISKINGVKFANVVLKNDEAVIKFDESEIQLSKISDAIADVGYDVRFYRLADL